MPNQRSGSPSLAVAKLTCFVPAAYFVASLGYALLHSASYAAALPQFTRYLAVPFAAGVLLFALPYLVSRMTAVRVGVAASVVLLGLFCAELVFAYQKFRILSLLAEGASAEQIYDRYDGIPPLVTPKIATRKLQITTLAEALLSGIPGTATFLCNVGDGEVHYTADRYGFNNPDVVYRQPIENLIIGDSFVEGMCQPIGEDIGSTIRRVAPATAAMGMRGAGPLFELAVLGRFGSALRPRRIVFLFFEGNDWENLENENQPDSVLRQGLDDDVDFGKPEIPPDRLQKFREILTAAAQMKAEPLTLLNNSSLLRNLFALQGVGAALGIAYPKVSLADPTYEAALVAAKRIASGWDGEIAVAYLPRVDRFVGLLPNGVAFESTRDLVRSATQTAGIGFIDLVPVFEQHENPRSLFAGDSHLNEAGAKVLAGPLLAFLGSANGEQTK